MKDDEDRMPKKTVTHEIGSDISLLSAGELETRIAQLEAEIARLKAAIAERGASRSAAESLFRK